MRVLMNRQAAASAISKPVKPEDVIGECGQNEIDVQPKVEIEGSDGEEAKVIPQSAGIAHVILMVDDDGEPSLTAYRRVIFTIEKLNESNSNGKKNYAIVDNVSDRQAWRLSDA
jgi:hypothetical protein